jgi:hypothetical protein
MEKRRLNRDLVRGGGGLRGPYLPHPSKILKFRKVDIEIDTIVIRSDCNTIPPDLKI